MAEGLRYGDVSKIWRRCLSILEDQEGEGVTLTLQTVHYHIKKGTFNTEVGELVEAVMKKVIEENEASKRKVAELA